MPQVSSYRNGSKRLNMDRSHNFLQTEEESSLKNELRALFEKTSTAKMSLDGFVVPNILFQWGQSNSNRPEQSYFTLSFLTTSNKIYILEMQSYFLLAGQTVFLKGPFSAGVHGTAKAFELSTKVRGLQPPPEFTYVIGTSYAGHMTENNFITYVYGDSQHGFQTLQVQVNPAVGERQIENIAINLKNKLIDGIKNKVKDAKEAISGSKSLGQANLQTMARGEGEDGVVALKQLPNQVLAVVVSSGYFYLVSCETGKTIAKYDLLTNLDSRQDLGASDRIVQAKLDFIKRPYNYGQQERLTFDLVVAFSSHSQSVMVNTLSWHLTELSITCPISSPINFDSTQANKLDLSDETQLPNFSMVKTISFAEKEEVVEIVFENQSLWVVTYNGINKQSQIVDLKARQRVWDKNSEISLESEMDRQDVQIELLEDPMSPYAEALIIHYIERLLKQGRFNISILRSAVIKYCNDYQLPIPLDHSSLHERDLLQIVADSQERQKGLIDILNFCISEQSKYIRVNGISKLMSYQGIRFIVRDIGISIVKQDSQFNTLLTSTNQIFVSLADLKKRENLTANLIRQSFPQISDDQAGLLISLIGAIKYLLQNSLLILDNALLNMPGNSFKELIQHVFLNSTINEALNYEISHTLDTNLASMYTQLHLLAESLISYLEDQAFKSEDLAYNFGMNTDDSQNLYTLPLLKMLERGLAKEIDAIYESLRDLLMAWEYFEMNSPVISVDSFEVIKNRGLYENCEAWLRQIVALRDVMRQELRVESVRQEEVDERQETLNWIQIISVNDEKPTYLTYAIVKNYQKSLRKEQINYNRNYQNEPKSSGLSETILQHFLRKMTFSISEQVKDFPPLINLLKTLPDSWGLIHGYIQYLLDSKIEVFQSLAIQISFAFSIANLNLSGNFVKQFQKCLMLFKEQEFSVEFDSLILNTNPYIRKEIILSLKDQFNATYKFYLIILSQLKGSDPKYELYVLKTALEDPSIIDVDTRREDLDQLYLRQYNIAFLIQGGLDYMHLSVMKSHSLNQKKQLIGQFTLHLYNLSKGSQLKASYLSQYFFSQDMIDQAMEYYVQKISAETPSGPFENISNLNQLIQVIIAIAQIYSRQIETTRYLWTLSQKLDTLIALCGQSTQNAYKQMLKLNKLILNKVYIFALIYGEHVLLLDESTVTYPSSNDYQVRDREDMQMREQVDGNTDDIIHKRGLGAIKVDHTLKKFPFGNLKRVTHEELQQKILLTEARIICSDYLVFSKDADYLIKYLSELGYYDLALDLALSSQSSVCYPVALMLKKYQLIQAGHAEFQFDGANDQAQWDSKELSSQQLKAHQKQVFQQRLLEILRRLSIRDKIEVARILSSEIVDVPQELEQEILREGHIRYLLEFYMSNHNLQLEKAVDLVRDNLPQSVKVLADIDLQLLVFFLTTLDDSKVQNVERLKELQKEERDRKDDLYKVHKHSDFECSEQFADDLSDFYGMDCTNSLYQHAIKEKFNEKGFDEELDRILTDIKTTTNFLNKATDCESRAKSEIVSYLNSRQ